MTMPPLAFDGQRTTINSGLDPVETAWHFRSALNVAALNCLGPDDQQIVDAYGTFLNMFSRDLASANREIDRRYREDASTSRAAIITREEHSTQVYNYFTMPAVRGDFCNIARQLSRQILQTPAPVAVSTSATVAVAGDATVPMVAPAPPPRPTDLNDFAETGLGMIENAFQRFFGKYAEYQVASSDWDARYGAQYGSSQPGYVSLYGSRSRSVGEALVTDQPEQVRGVIDPDTGGVVPIVPANEGNVRTPVVQPVPGDGAGAGGASPH